ncbi:MAG TPA: site-2 protease family protein [Candidatus Limnocylindrales bacterium]|jgi:Zn-dependent protease
MGWRSAPILGVRLYIGLSWLIVFGLIVIALEALGVFPAEVSTALRWLAAVAIALLFFASVAVHELAHAVVARRFGVDVSEIGLGIIGTQGQLERRAATPRGEMAIALAGPLLSLAIGSLAIIAWVMLGNAGDGSLTIVADVLWLVGMSNVLLGALNLLPGFPFDGGRVVRAALWARTRDFLRSSRLASLAGRGVAYAVIAIGLLWAATGGQNILNGAWLALLGWFLNQAARMHYRRLEATQLVEGLSVGDVMDEQYAVVGPNLTLDTLLGQQEIEGTVAVYPVTDDGRLLGTLDVDRARRYPRQRWPTLRVGEVMTTAERLPSLTALSSVMEALTFFDRTRAQALPVIDSPATRRLVGMITREGLVDVLRRRRKATELAA